MEILTRPLITSAVISRLSDVVAQERPNNDDTVFDVHFDRTSNRAHAADAEYRFIHKGCLLRMWFKCLIES